MRPIDADCFREKILKFRSKAVEKWGEDGTVQITGVVDSLVKKIDDTPTIDLESLFFTVGKRADNLDKLYTKIQAVTGITPERLLELLLPKGTRRAKAMTKSEAVIWLEKVNAQMLPNRDGELRVEVACMRPITEIIPAAPMIGYGPAIPRHK